MKHLPHALLGLLLALGVTACDTIEIPEDASDASSASSHGSYPEPWVAPPESPSIDAPPNMGAGAPSSAGPSATRYVSPLGFSIDLPTAVLIGSGHVAPLAAFEDPTRNRVFLTPAAYDDPSTPAFDRTPTSIDALSGKGIGVIPYWVILRTDIEGDTDLLRFVKIHYGPGCGIAEMAPTAQDGVLDVLLEGDGLPLDETRCVLNFAYELRYQPGAKRAFSWELGQGVQFTDGRGAPLDLQMRDSVRLL